MELDELKTQWADYGQKLDASLRLNRQLLAERQFDRVRQSLFWTKLGYGIEAALTLLILLWTGGFVADHVHEAKFLIPGLALHLYFILILAFEIQVLVASSIDFAKPVLELRKSLEKARIREIRLRQWVFLTVFLVWAPGLVVFVKSVLHLDAYRMFGTPWLLANLLTGLAIIPLALLAAHKLKANPKTAPWVAKLRDSLTGESLRKASARLDETAEFESLL